MSKHPIFAEQVHIARVVHGPADFALLIEAVGGEHFEVGLTLPQVERLAALLDAHTRSRPDT